ncbi:MAG TPA: response regulator [Polyangiaceae bacterium]
MAVEKRIETILVVDDNPHNRALAEAHLKSFGYNVAMAESGAQALDLVKEVSPSLVLLDVVMPKMDGYECCARLRMMKEARDLPIVFLTALSDVSSHQRAMDSGVDDFLTKPINRTELLLRVRSLLRISALNRDLKSGYETIRTQHDALVRAQRQREELMQHVVHDLKNPLGAIEMNARYLLSSLPADDLLDATRDIVDSAGALRRMVMNLLDICRSEEGELVPTLSEVNVDKLVTTVIGEHTRESIERHVELRGTVSPNCTTVRADQDLLRRVLENLVVNAIRHAPRKSSIEVYADCNEDNQLELHVRDNGEGVPEAFREKVFDKYVRLEPSPSSLSNRGLGLTFCRIAVEAHGGKVWVEPNRPSGADFIVRLPRRAA